MKDTIVSQKVYIFTELGVEIGLGHLSRCVALYKEIEKRNYEPRLILAGDTEPSYNLQDFNVTFMNWWDIKAYPPEFFNNVVYAIIDSYTAVSKLYDFISHNVKRVVYLDDTDRIEYPDGTIINPAPSIDSLDYSRGNRSKLFYGEEYIILRPAFHDKQNKTIKGSVREVLISLGGGKSQTLNEKLISHIINQEDMITFHMILNKNQYDIFSLKYDLHNLNFYNAISAAEMRYLMNRSDLAISGAGQSIYELIYMQVPFIAVKTAENQCNNIKLLEETYSDFVTVDARDKEVVLIIAEKLQALKDPAARKELSSKHEKLIDGQGSRRVIDLLLNEKPEIKLIKADHEHIRKVFNLSNKDYVRRYSINQDFILWDDHVVWYENVIKDPNIVFYLVFYNDQFVGQVRYKIEDNFAIIGISLSDFIRGKGLSKPILMESLDRLFCERNIEFVEAEIFADNIASVRMFESTGFTLLRKCENQLIYVLKRV